MKIEIQKKQSKYQVICIQFTEWEWFDWNLMFMTLNCANKNIESKELDHFIRNITFLWNFIWLNAFVAYGILNKHLHHFTMFFVPIITFLQLNVLNSKITRIRRAFGLYVAVINRTIKNTYNRAKLRRKIKSNEISWKTACHFMKLYIAVICSLHSLCVFK